MIKAHKIPPKNPDCKKKEKSLSPKPFSKTIFTLVGCMDIYCLVTYLIGQDLQFTAFKPES